MNRPLPKSTKDFFSTRLIAFCILLLVFGESYSQVVTISAASGGLSTPPLTGGTTNHAIFGVQLSKDAVAANTVTTISFGLSSDPTGKFTNARLYESTDATFSGIGTEVLVTAGTLSATNVSFTGAPLTNFDGATTAVDNEFFFVVVDVAAGATGTITPSLTTAGVTVSTSTVSGSTITGTTFDFLTADFTQNTDDATGFADEDDVTLLDFTVNSNGTQSLSAPLVLTFNTNVTSILENWDLQVGGVNILGAETYTLNGAGTQLTIDLFTAVDVTNATIFTLLADIQAGAVSANDFTITLAPAGVTISPGIPEAFGTFTNIVDVTGLEADFTQNTDDATAVADENDITLLDFTVNSNGTQSLSAPLVFTFSTNVTSILENWDLQVGGVNILGAETYTLNGAGTQLTIDLFTAVDVTNATIFTLLADIQAGAVSANDFTITLAPAGVTISPGIPEAFGTFTNIVDVTGLEADFTQNTDDANAYPDQNGVELLDFSVNSNGTQTISPNLVFTFNTNVTSILENWDLQVGGVDIPGTEIYTLNGAGTQLTISGFTGVDVTNATNFQLFADIQAGATPSNDFIITLIPANVTIAPGIVEAFGTFSNSIDIATSQLSDIILNGGTTDNIPYISHRGSNVTVASPSLATFRIRDGAGVNDPDGAGTTLISLEIQLTNNAMVKQIALYDGATEIGTEQTVSGPTVTFTGISLATSDGAAGTKDFTVRATFQNLVTDNFPIHVTITDAVALNTGSGFADPEAGDATTTGLPAPANRIEVVVTALVLSGSPPTSQIATNFPLTLEAKDAQNNIDLDYASQVILTATGGAGTLTVQAGQSLTPTLTAGVYNWTTLRISQSGVYELKVSDNPYDDNFTDPTTNITIQSSASTINPSTDPVLCYGAVASAEVLSNIVITETDPAGFSGTSLPQSYTFSLALPSGFVFDQTVTTGVSVGGGGDLTAPSGYTYPGANVVEFSFTLNGTANINTITISGLKARYPHPGTSAPGPTGVLNITRLGGTANIAGVGAGSVLGTISATQQNPAVAIEVEELTGNPNVDPTTTTFNVSSVAVKLITNPGSALSQSVFTGTGVTSNPEYRFNPNSLSPANYPVTVTHTNPATGCQSFNTKTFEVIISGIVNLASEYCANEAPSGELDVNDAYIDQIMGEDGWSLDHFVYYDHNSFNWNPIIAPAAWPNEVFAPGLSTYAAEYQYWGGQIPIGFAVCNNLAGYPCGFGNSTYIVTYQWVTVRPAPTVSFTILDSNGDSKTSFCLGDAAVDLVGTPPNSDDINEDYFRIDGNPDIRLSQVGTSPKAWKFTPGPTGVAGPVGPFTITYSYIDPATLCRGTSLPVQIKVNEVVPNITFPNDVCAGDPVSITNTTSVRPPAASIVSAGWNFGDQVTLPPGPYLSTIPSGSAERTSGTYRNPSHLYQGNGTFQISSLITTSDGCMYTTPQQPVDINPVPVANFTWENVCLGSPTLFNATQNLPDGDISSWVWDFAIGPLTTGTGTGKNTSFQYPSAGKDTVRLIVTSNALCRDTVFKPVFIVPTYVPTTPGNSYAQDFTLNDGWIAGGVNSSWNLGTPTGLPIVGDASTSGTGNAWDTNLTGDNNTNESSWVLSGCFDFTGTVKPVISLDVWSDNPSGVDGAVLQYNITGNIEDDIPNDPDPDGDWERIGAVGSGINWYDDQGISNSPGNQTTISAGWTGNYPQWKKAIFKLDPLVGQSKVVLRIAFASSQPRGDGFAFDNIFVGERSRTVLLENFTNSSADPSPANHNEDNYQNFPSTGSSTELVKIQYHTAFPGTDPINSLNQQMNNSRAAFYGITQSPTIRMDGDFKNGNISSWLEPLYDDRVLTPSPIKLDTISVDKVGDFVKINISVENTTSQALPVQGVHIFTTIVDKSITDSGLLGNSGNTEFVFVAKQMLPSAAGIPLEGVAVPTELGAGEIFSTEVTWENPNGDAIVIFVQSIEGNNKNVYQALFIDNPVLPEVVTGTEDPAYSEKINLFPNPASQEVNIELPAVVTRSTPVMMFDTYGRTVYQNSFAPGEQTKKVNTTGLAGGVYIIQISTPGGHVARRKVMVTHR